MATFTNQTKTVSTQTNQSFSGLTQWAKPTITWADSVVGWGVLLSTGYVNRTKNTSTTVNQTKN